MKRQTYFFVSLKDFFWATVFWSVLCALSVFAIVCTIKGSDPLWHDVIAIPLAIFSGWLAVRSLCNGVKFWMQELNFFYGKW